MPSDQNIQLIDTIKDKINNAKSVAIVDYSGTTVNDQVELRAALAQVGGEMFVTKNTLMAIAFDKPEMKESLEGMNALIFSIQDEVSALKAVVSFRDDKEKLTIKQGFYQDRVLSAEEVEQLSKLPGKEELLAALMNRLQAPASGLVTVLKAGQRDLVYVLQAISKKDGTSTKSETE